MPGLDRRTGKALDGWPHVVQSIEVILTTGFGERLMLEWFGSLVPRLLGQNMTQPLLLRFVHSCVVAIELWEPRFKVRRVLFAATPESLRAGHIGFAMLGDYLPRGHLGDARVEGQRQLTIGYGADGFTFG